MSDSTSEFFTKSRLISLRKMWSKQDSKKGETWEFDGILSDPDHWMSYDHEMSEGLGKFGCRTFDELVTFFANKLNRKPNVIDLMGGAYFLSSPENTESLVGIRVDDKDQEFQEENKGIDDTQSQLLNKILAASNRRIVEADVLSNEGWKKIKGLKLPPADILVCRPVGPFDNLRAMNSKIDNPMAYVGLYTSLFRRSLSLVNRNGGVFFSEVPDIFSDTEIERFFNEVDNNERTHTTMFTVSNRYYHLGGAKRRCVVVQF